MNPYHPTPADPPDPEWRATIEGGHALVLEGRDGHALVVQYGDCSFALTCQCGGCLAPDVHPDRFQLATLKVWTGHLRQVDGVAQPVEAHCQCGTRLRGVSSQFTRRWFDAITTAWERHTTHPAAAQPAPKGHAGEVGRG